jgi:hypothetical protein
MPIDLKETFPFTHSQAVEVLKDGEWNNNEVNFILEGGLPKLHVALSPVMRQCWGMADRTYPLNKYYRYKMGLGNPDDMSSLILREFYSYLSGDATFNLEFEAMWVKKHWHDQGVDPLTMERSF